MHSLQNDLNSTPAAAHWQKIGVRHHHGVDIPLFSLRTKHSCGIGEFCDLIPLIDWCKEIGFDTIQLLPLNDTGPESSPYSLISAFALNPIHLSLHQLPNVDQFADLAPLLTELRQLSEKPQCDYPTIRQKKREFLLLYLQKANQALSNSEGYKKFFSDNSWLEGYALFKAIKEATHWKPWALWGHELINPAPQTLQTSVKHFAEEIFHHSLIQYLCFLQMQKVHDYAKQRQVYLMGDIPILLSKESADVWLNRELFDMNFNAGAPPDMYAEDGQNWGFPTYNWKALRKDDYLWWKERLRVAELCYDLYRIDHVVGFFRIWSIPEGHKGSEGKFIPEDPSSWISHGTDIMKMMLESSSMLPIGEDLGTVPPAVRICLRSLGICGTKVMRWERMWDEDKRFIPFAEYNPISMTTVSTHDSDTLQLWWQNSPREAGEYAKFKGWDYQTSLTREQQESILYDSHHTASLFHINPLQEYLALFDGLTWPNLEDERINIPGLVSSRNWSYRFKPFMEEIRQHEALRLLMKKLSR